MCSVAHRQAQMQAAHFPVWIKLGATRIRHAQRCGFAPQLGSAGIVTSAGIRTTRALPVFLVHGFRVLSKDTDEETSLSSMRAALLRRGHTQVHKFDYPSREDSLQNHAASLADFISSNTSDSSAKDLAITDGGPVDFALVSHSFGGVVVRAALRILQERGQLAADGARVRVVMLAPPNKGSALARALRPDDSASWLSAAALNYAFSYFLGDKAGRQLAAGQGFPALPAKTAALVIAGSLGAGHPLLRGVTDGVVAEAETALDTPHLRMTLTAPHHLLPHHPSAIRATLDFLAGGAVPGAFPAPGSARAP